MLGLSAAAAVGQGGQPSFGWVASWICPRSLHMLDSSCSNVGNRYFCWVNVVEGPGDSSERAAETPAQNAILPATFVNRWLDPTITRLEATFR